MNIQRKYIIMAILIALCGFALITVYSVYLLNKDEPEPEEDPNFVLEQIWKEDIGVADEEYAERELYTNEMYEVDKKTFLYQIKTKNFDLLTNLAEMRTSKYQFSAEHLSTMDTLSRAYIFNEDSEATSSDRVMFVTGLSDPEIYILFFMMLSPSEQAQMIMYQNVNRLPGWPYEITEVTKEKINHYKYSQISIEHQECYKITMKYRQEEIIVRMIYNGCLYIFDINNAAGTYDSVKYN